MLLQDHGERTNLHHITRDKGSAFGNHAIDPCPIEGIVILTVTVSPSTVMMACSRETVMSLRKMSQ